MLYKLITPIFISLVIFFVLSTKNIDLLDNSSLTIDTHSDIYNGGSSEISILSNTSGKLEYRYKIGDVYKYPYAGINIKKSDNSFINLNRYNTLEISLKTVKTKKLMLTFYNFVNGYTDLNRFETYYPLYYEIPVSTGFTDIKIPLNKLKTHGWWIDKNSKTKKLNIPDLSSVIYFELNNSEDFPKEVEDIVTIEKFKINRDKIRVTITIIAALLIYFLLILFSNLRKREKNLLKVISYESLEIKDNNEEDSRIEQFISENYMNPELCITMICDSLGLSTKQVSEGINRKYNISFPNYLNLIRINESKRLLKETNKKVIDIAIEVGYNTPVHFNRIFKKQENVTPREYRKKWENH